VMDVMDVWSTDFQSLLSPLLAFGENAHYRALMHPSSSSSITIDNI